MQLNLFSHSGPINKIKKRSKKTLRAGFANNAALNLWDEPTQTETEMALLFLDIRNFTPLVEAHAAADVVYIVKKLFSRFQSIIRIHRGRIVETTGDGFYAAFGFNQNIKEAVNDAVQAGMMILKNLENLNEKSFEKNLKRRIEVGIGVHAGKVATGSMHLGLEDHMLIMGYPVNIASRLQMATKELNNNFIISSEVFQLLNPRPTGGPMAEVHLRGVKENFRVHLLGQAYTAGIFSKKSVSCF